MNTVIYDGECRFCIGQVQNFKNADVDHNLTFLPRQEPDAERLFPQIANIPLDDGIIVVDAKGKLHVAADGIHRIAQELPTFKWKLFAALYPVPGIKQAVELCYRIIAANRKRLGQTCSGGVCAINDAKTSR